MTGNICSRSSLYLRDVSCQGACRHWKTIASILASGLFVASCMGSGQTTDSRFPAFASMGDSDPPPAMTVTRNETRHPPASSPLPDTAGSHPADALSSERTVSGLVSTRGTSHGGQRVSLRPMNNLDAGDLLDHWGHRHVGPVLLQEPGADHEVADFQALLEIARGEDGETRTPGLREGDTISALGHRHGVVYGRWSGGPADTLSIEFDVQNATDAMREDATFRAALERAGKVWSRRIDDTWQEWERRAGESKGRLIGDYGTDGKEIRVGPGGETSTGLVIYVTGGDLAAEAAGMAGFRSIRPGNEWEPHTGAMIFDNEYIEGAEEASLLAVMVHEIGHVLGAWYGDEFMNRYAPFTDSDAGTWTGSHVVAVHGGPAPFQDSDDTHGWHDGERNSDAGNFDFAHSGVCASVMAYCRDSAAIPAFLPAQIDFAFLADLGLTINEETNRPETYGLAGWMDHSAFTLSVSRELDVSLADPQPRYFINGAGWQSLDAVDLLWAEADALGHTSNGNPASSFPPGGMVRYSGGLIGTAVDSRGLPPVYGDANVSLGLDSLAGKASFTSLRMSYGGERYVFGSGSLHYPIFLENNAIETDAPGVSLVGNFYGPQHEEVAGTLDDSRAGLLASFGARHDERPAYIDAIAAADHVRGMMYQDGFSEEGDGWSRFRYGAGAACEGKFEWWKPENDWYDVSATQDESSRERVLTWTAGWGDWVSEDMFADHGEIRIVRRYANATDGGTGRYQRDGYFGVMEYAAYGAGFYRYTDWSLQDGDTWDFYIQGAGFQGELSGTRPAGGAIWEGRMVGYQGGLEAGEEPFVQCDAKVSVSFGRNQVDIGFSGITSTDFKRSLADFGFDDIPLNSDGTFDGFDQGVVEGAFFGPAHQEVAGMFQRNDNSVMGSFGALNRE